MQRCPLNLLQNFQKGGGGLTGSQVLEGVSEKEGWFFSGGCRFYIKKNKLKSEKIAAQAFEAGDVLNPLVLSVH